ncbi:hypothetical protein KNE206_15940 [Kitasatospora sp. NE20-6]|uniref:hypothetical protein n=1 Tax=Kitasatospora sp. NE20-6 TaxID=2859066 RepID=UPI0034DBA0F7
MTDGAGRPRYEPYALPLGDGHGVWDHLLGKRVEQPGLVHSHWFPRPSLARAWADRENAAYEARVRAQARLRGGAGQCGPAPRRGSGATGRAG